MGRWDCSIFGSDDAGDWVWELEEEGLASGLKRTVEDLKEAFAAEESIDVPECEIAVAAAAVAAMLRGMPRVEPLTPELEQVLDDAEFQPGTGLLAELLALLEAALSERSDLSQPDMWGSEADQRQWRGNVMEVKRFLEGELSHG